MLGEADKNAVTAADEIVSSDLAAGEPGTRERLIRAALTEFNDKGYLGTDTNRIEIGRAHV